MKLAQLADVPPIPPAIATSEGIAFQHNDRFGPELEAIIARYMEMVDKGMTPDEIDAQGDIKKEMEKLVKDRLGITMTFITNRIIAACVPNVYVMHSAVVRDALRDMLDPYASMMGIGELRARTSGKSLGTVNTQTAKMTGWLSEQVVPVYLNFTDLKKVGLTSPRDIAAIMLHELGHAFESAAKAITVNNSNQIIGDVIKHISDKNRGGDIDYIYLELQKLDPNITRDTAEGLKSDSSIVFGIAAFRTVQGCIRSLSGSSTYDRTSNEALADSFAVRFGYGEGLVSGLDKILNDPSRKVAGMLITAFNTVIYYVLITSILAFINKIAAVGLAGVTMWSIYAFIVNTIGLIVLTIQNRLSTGDYEYDNDPDRIKRIRSNLVEALKDPSISRDTKITILEQIKLADSIHKRTLDIPNPIRILLTALFRSDQQSYIGIKTQQKIELLLANDLFVKAAQLQAKA